jgi:DNA-binding MarR family transcriptional regulator
MLKHGWIEEVPDDGDQRGAPIQTTAIGRKLLQRSAPAWRSAQTRAKKMLGSNGVDLLFTTLKGH